MQTKLIWTQNLITLVTEIKQKMEHLWVPIPFRWSYFNFPFIATAISHISFTPEKQRLSPYLTFSVAFAAYLPRPATTDVFTSLTAHTKPCLGH